MKMTDEEYMKIALKEAEKAFEADEVPVGAIVVLENRIIAKAHNQVELLKDSTAHAEILALTTAYQYLGAKYIPEATVYITLEPCLMCCGAMYWGKIGSVKFGAYDEKNGYRGITSGKSPFHPKTEVIGGILENECASLMKEFFRKKR